MFTQFNVYDEFSCMLVLKYYYFTTKQKKPYLLFILQFHEVFNNMFYIDAIVQGDTTKVGMVDN